VLVSRRVLRHAATYAVLRMSGCTLYSFAKTKGTMPWGRAACSFRRFLQSKKSRKKQPEHSEKEMRGKGKVTFVLPAERKRPERERERERERGD
jgi:hypothetical protein